MAIDFNKYKTEINLVDYLVRIKGWKVEEKGRRPKLVEPINNEKYIFGKNSLGQYTYYKADNPTNGPDRGLTIFDFLQREAIQNGSTLSFQAIANSLDIFMQSGEYIEPAMCDFDVNEPLTAAQLKITLSDLKPLSDQSYLQERGFNNELLNSSFIKETLFQKTLFNKASKESKQYIAFKLNDIHGNTTGISMKSREEKGKCIGFKSESFVCSKVQSKTQPIEIILGESYLDLMSYLQLNFEALKDRNIYLCSSEGNLTEEQINYIQKIVDNYKPGIDNIKLTFDNDPMGHVFTTRCLLNLVTTDSIFKKDEILSIVSKDEISFMLPVNENYEFQQQKIIDFIKNIDSPFVIELLSNKEGEFGKFTIEAPSSIKNWSEFNNTLNCFFHGNNSLFNIEMPISKDFNLDLKNFNELKLKKIDNSFNI